MIVKSAEQKLQNDRKEVDKMLYRVKELREKNGLTQTQLAKKSGVSRVTIAMLESKTGHTTTTRTLIKIAEALGTTVDEIFFTNPVQST